MSAPTNAAAAKADSKRGRSSEAESTGPDSTDRSVRQCIEPSAGLSAPAASAASSAAVSSATVAPSRVSFMRLAVVERQLIMQGLDLTSLARLASTCRQMRAEAVHREAGKFIPQPPEESALRLACALAESYPAHASPLFRSHMPMSLGFCGSSDAVADSASIELLLDKAALFSRVTTFSGGHSDAWAEPQMLRLLSLPCMQHAHTVAQFESVWIENPRVQTALLSLPQLTDIRMAAGPSGRLLPSAVASASKWAAMYMYVEREDVASVRSLRALHLAPALSGLYVSLCLTQPVLAEFVWCLPPTLTHLSLTGHSFPRNLPRPLAKALFSRTPLLNFVELNGSIKPIVQGLMDAGLPVLSLLRQVLIRDVTPDEFSFDEDPDPIPALLRRFLHRFPEVTVLLLIEPGNWQDPQQLSAMLLRYLVWPRVELYWAGSDERIAAPPSPHASDDEDGSDVEEFEDPLAAEPR